MHSKNGKLYIVMVGLPARGKTTTAVKIKENLAREDIAVEIFNNGDVRRRLLPQNTSHADFYNPANTDGALLRDEIALVNIYQAKAFLEGGGQVAILDATNASRQRRWKVQCHFTDHPILFVECVNEDADLVSASITRKIRGAEFEHMDEKVARKSFEDRIRFYRNCYDRFQDEDNWVTLDSLNYRIMREQVDSSLPYYSRIRDVLVSDWVKSLFLVRHGQTHYNVEDRIGGNSELTEKGRSQSEALAEHFKDRHIPYIFTSSKTRTQQMAAPLLKALGNNVTHIVLPEFDEIDAGECENLTYQEIRTRRPDVHEARSADKYNYVYPLGEGYVTLKERVNRGLKKALFLSGNVGDIMIIGHQAVNRMILSHFLYRRTEDVPYIYIPMQKYFHIVSTQSRKVFELRRFMESGGQ